MIGDGDIPEDAFLPYARRDTAPRYRLWGGLAAFFAVAGVFFETWVPPVCLSLPALIWLGVYHRAVARHRALRALAFREGRELTGTVTGKRVETGMLYQHVELRYELDGRPYAAEQPVPDRVGARCRDGLTVPILVHPDHPRAWIPAALRSPQQGSP